MAKTEKKAKPEEEKKNAEPQTPDTAPETADAAAKTPVDAETQPDEAAQADARLQELEAQLLQANDKFLRTLAEYDNYRKRSVREKEQAYADSKASVLAELLPVLDNFERAACADASYEDYRKGVEMIFNQLSACFEKLGVESFGAAGDAFDPNIHNAVMHVEDENAADNTVAEVFSKGYKLGDKILRPAVVKVAN